MDKESLAGSETRSLVRKTPLTLFDEMTLSLKDLLKFECIS